MSEYADDCRAMREEQRARNAERKAREVQQLEADVRAGRAEVIAQFNHGTHWRVVVNGVRYDWWPSTGRWRRCSDRATARGGYPVLVRDSKAGR